MKGKRTYLFLRALQRFFLPQYCWDLSKPRQMKLRLGPAQMLRFVPILRKNCICFTLPSRRLFGCSFCSFQSNWLFWQGPRSVEQWRQLCILDGWCFHETNRGWLGQRSQGGRGNHEKWWRTSRFLKLRERRDFWELAPFDLIWI